MAVTPLTSAEREAVKQFKSRLDLIKQEANISEGYKLWDIALHKDSADPRLDILLVKFLRARDLDLTKASQMLKNTLIWRKDFRADELLDEPIDDSVLGSVSYIYKEDKRGRPVCYNFYGDIDQEKVFADVQKFIRWRVQVMERGVQLIDFVNTDSMVVIHDYRNASLFGRTQNAKAATKEIIKIMQDNYPEFLAVKFFVNVPSWGSMIFKLIRPLLSEATTKKFVVCSNNELYETLTNTIEAAKLPTVYQKVGDKNAVKMTKERSVETKKQEQQQKEEEEEEQSHKATDAVKAATAEDKAVPLNADNENTGRIIADSEEFASDKPADTTNRKGEANIVEEPVDNRNTEVNEALSTGGELATEEHDVEKKPDQVVDNATKEETK